MNKFYVYMYLDLENVPFYVGKGKDDRYKLRRHAQKYCSNCLLTNKICKVGIDNIKIHFLHKNLTEEEAFYWERYWIKYIGRRDKKKGSLCNLTDGGEGDSGWVCSVETKRKISEAHKGVGLGKNLSKAHKQKISEANKGFKHSEETKQKMCGPRKPLGPPSDAHKKKISVANKGRKFSKDHKKSISEALKGHKVSEETRRKMSNSHKGKKE